MPINLRQTIREDVFDYLQLTEALSSYGNVWSKITRLLSGGEIIRLKKGLYAFPEPLRKAPLNPCMIANMLYGPSYVSCDYALSYYGLIPEKVELVTSMTTGRPREFKTPAGTYQYIQHRSHDYACGIRMEKAAGSSFLIAEPEKAVYDKALTDRRFNGTGIVEYLREDLRLDEEQLGGLNREIFLELHDLARGKMRKLTKYLLETIR